MAVIQKIRDKYAKLAGFAVALALVGFILMDAASGRLSDLFGRDNSVAKVNGHKIDYKEYTERIQEYESLYEALGNNKIDDNTMAQIHDQVLKEMIYEKLITDQMDDLGLTITKEEEKDMIVGANPDPLVKQFPYFKNPETGQFDPQYLMQFEQNKLDLSNPQAQKAMELWQSMKSYIKRQRLIQKYNSLFVNAVYTPDFIINRQLKDQNFIGGVQYVKVPYTSVNDNEVKVTDADLKAYMEKHAAQYTIEEPTRSIDYVSFDLNPSSDDTTRVLTALNQLKSDFASDTDVESFVNKNSDEQYVGHYVNKKNYMSAYADSILQQPVGSVYGPFYENGSYDLVKILDKATLPDSVKVRHILIKTEDRGQEIVADSIAKRKIDSVTAAINAGADFKQLAEKYSDDQGSKTNGGEYTFSLQQRPTISKEFADFVFEGKPGQTKVVKVDNDQYAGYHYIEILNQQDYQPTAKIAIITKPLFASEETEQTAYAKANEFAGRNGNGKAFDDAIKSERLNRLQAQNIKVNDFVLPGLGSSREIIRWMYDAKVGDVSPVFSLDGRYVVAKLTNIQDEGMMQLDASNRPMLESLVKAQKKADVIAKKYKSMTSLASIAQSAAQQIQNADSFNAANPYVMNLGYEPKVVGYTFFDGFKQNAVSPAIKGQDGVFYTTLKYRQQMPVNPQDPMQQQMQMMQSMQLKNAIAGSLQQSMLRNATIKYNAKNLY
jgi:peptidyl-prolyl cis-trans isomerase D